MFGINVDPSKAPGKSAPDGKPQMRGLLIGMLKKRAIGAAVFCLATGVIIKFALNNRRLNHYRDFYENYDANADFERMKKAGVFRSVKPDGSIGEL